MLSNSDLCRITVVTPSYNQAPFLEHTIRSVLDQGYPNIEYIIIDGGSTDGSVDIIKRYERHLSYWVSEPDRGQAHAINKGLMRATGEWVGWQNSDDIYFPGSFQEMARAARKHKNADLIIGDLMLLDERGRALRDVRYVRPSYGALLAEGMVLANQAAFWRRSVHDNIGFLDERLDCGFDYEWFLRLTKYGQSVHVGQIWGGLRLHAATKTERMQEQFKREFREILGGRSVSRVVRRAYQMRRALLMLMQGNLGYVMRGLHRRYRLRSADCADR